MSIKNFLLQKEVLAILLMSILAITGIVQETSSPIKSYPTGQIIPLCSGIEIQTLEKSVEQTVNFNAKVKNIGDIETIYVIKALFRDDSGGDWETVGTEQVTLGPSEYKVVIVGGITCTETMCGKNFDVKFILYDLETEAVLDEKVIDKAWNVRETIAVGAIVEYWVD